MGSLLHCCVEVHELIKLSLGVMSGISLGIGVLDEVQVPQREKGLWEGFALVSVVKAYFFAHNNGLPGEGET